MTNAKEQLAGLVEDIGDEMDIGGTKAVFQVPAETLSDWRIRLNAILATLPEPGVVTEEAVEAALNGFFQEGPVTPRTEYAKESMRCALSDAMPYLAPAAPAGEVGFKAWLVEQMPTGTVIGNPEWWAERIARAYELNIPQPVPAAQGFDAEVLRSALEEIVRRMPDQAGPAWIVKDIAQAALAAAAKGFDAEFWKKAWVEERARAYRREGMTVEQAKIHAETDAASALAAAAKKEAGNG